MPSPAQPRVQGALHCVLCMSVSCHINHGTWVWGCFATARSCRSVLGRLPQGAMVVCWLGCCRSQMVVCGDLECLEGRTSTVVVAATTIDHMQKN